MLTASSFYPTIKIGSVISLNVDAGVGKEQSTESHGDFIVTSIEHFVNENGNYYNSFEAIPAGVKVIPVSNIIMPIAETQVATVVDNKDENNMGRVKVEMLWQKENGDKTDWIRVMTPDAGQGDGSDSKGRNRGLLCIPEIGDQVLVGFRYNDPDRPFVLGSLFTGLTGMGGGDQNFVKSFSTKTGSIIKFEENKISIIDAKKKSKILFDGEGKMEINSEEEITLKCGQSSIIMKRDGTIEIKGDKITLDASSKIVAKCSGGNVEIKSTGGDVKIEGINTELSAQASAKVKANATAELTSSGQTTVKGAMVMIN